MTKKMILSIGVISIALCAAAPTQEFTMPRKRTTGSACQLKEQIADQLAGMLSAVPPILTSIAQIQERVLVLMQQYLTNSKGCFWQTSDKAQLAQILHQVQREASQLEKVKAQLEHTVQALGKLHGTG